MSQEVVLPALGESVTEGTVTRWLKAVGDTVAVDEALVEISTDKVDTEIPSPVAGVVERILVAEDEVCEVGAVLVVIGDGSGGGVSVVSPAPAAEPVPEPAPAAEPVPAPAAPRHAASPNPVLGDSSDVVLPTLGESITEGTVTRWLKQPGDSVAVDEPLLEVSTDKVDTEVPSPVAGTLLEIAVAEDETVEVGGLLCRIGSALPPVSGQQPAVQSETVPPAPAAQATSPAQADQAAVVSEPAPSGFSASSFTPPVAASAEASTTSASVTSASVTSASVTSAPVVRAEHVYVTPIVRKLAAQLGVKVVDVTGTGVGGRIRKEDVIEHANRKSQFGAASQSSGSAAVAPEADAQYTGLPNGGPPVVVSALRGTAQKMSRLRKVIANRAVASLAESAQLTTVIEVDVTRVAQLRAARKEDFLRVTGNKLSFMPFFVLAAAEALRVYPIVNAAVEDEEIRYPATENMSIAVDTDRGLLTPVIKNVGELNIAEIAAQIADLAERTRSGKVGPDELAGGTFTLTNTGSRGALFDTPLVFQPQSAILGTGAVVKRAVVLPGDAIAVRSMVYLALSYDHRIIDGADAARFLGHIKQRLEASDLTKDLGI